MTSKTAELEQELKAKTSAEVYFDQIHRTVYSVDASIYEIEPIGVVIPRNEQDLLETIKIAQRRQISLTARGAATGITGGCIGAGLVIDLSRYFNRILEINYEEMYAICEVGVIQDQLNQALAERGFRLGPDTSTGDRATLGGMMGNNAAGSRSLRYGTMVDHVLEVTLAHSNGELITYGQLSADEWATKSEELSFEGRLYQEIHRIKETYAEEIKNNFPDLPRRASGYNLNELLKQEGINLSKIITGSEGTLGIATKMKVRIARKPQNLGLCILHFHDFDSGLQHIEKMLAFSPVALEMIDDKIIEAGKASPSMRQKLDWLHENPKMILAAEFDGATLEETKAKLKVFEETMQSEHIGYAHTILTNPKEMQHVWDIRKAGLGLLLSKRSYSRAIAFIEDVSIPPRMLQPFMTEFQAYLAKHQKEAGVYGHAGPGCLHVRPYINLRDPKENALMKQMMIDVADILLKMGGSLSGEHGDGIIRAWLTAKMFGPKLTQAFTELKKAFDPDLMMNPGKILPDQDVLENLRIDPKTPVEGFKTFLNFEKEGGLELSVDLCNGNGLCRKKEGVMCPSFQATQNEYDTTRARAQALRGYIHGKFPPTAQNKKEIYDVLDLCLQCKGCKTDCPSQVDMAKLKSEFLYHYYQDKRVPLRSKIFGHIDRLSYLLTFLPDFSKSKLTKWLLSKIGISPQRDLPTLAPQTFSTWFVKHQQPAYPRQVVLFIDTFTEYYTPEIGQDALKVLNALNFEVIVPPLACCGRPLISKGLLGEAKSKALALIDILFPYAVKKLPIIGLEPSCLLTIRQDFPDFFKENAEKIETIATFCQTFDEFVYQHAHASKFSSCERQVKFHGHCYAKTLVGDQPSMEILKKVQPQAILINSGCCGMAGSFGYESEHYEISMKIGNLKLFPSVKNFDGDIIANGTSCRAQIEDGTGKKALHMAQYLARHLN